MAELNAIGQIHNAMPPPPSPLSNPANPLAEHKVLVTLMVLVVVGMVASEWANSNKVFAQGFVILLIGIFILLGINQSGRLQGFLAGTPFIPPQGG